MLSSAKQMSLGRGIVGRVAAGLILLLSLAAGASDARPEEASLIEPGVLDVQAWDWLQQDLERMIGQTKAHARNRLSPAAFEAKYFDATVDFLEIDTERTQLFKNAANKALDEIKGARHALLGRNATLDSDIDETQAMLASRAGWDEYRKAQRRAVRYPLAVLEARPRHQLLREQMQKWLLRLDYGIGAASR